MKKFKHTVALTHDELHKAVRDWLSIERPNLPGIAGSMMVSIEWVGKGILFKWNPLNATEAGKEDPTLDQIVGVVREKKKSD